MENDTEPSPKDASPIVMKQTAPSPDSSPIRHRHTPPQFLLKHPGDRSKYFESGHRPVHTSSPEGRSPGFRLRGPTPLLKRPVRCKLFNLSPDPKAEKFLKKRALLETTPDFLASKKAKISADNNGGSSSNRVSENPISDGDESENSIELSPRRYVAYFYCVYDQDLKSSALVLLQMLGSPNKTVRYLSFLIIRSSAAVVLIF
ncbi:hypothetical protein HYPSUDRAFT_58785 [Hypholoma sublateritium FD-334 SS-4]|uniref:Uncharacterized protein n=1 Tax=Hypholoma sublateritium (strain FD-334 SS-4) TaxID=945553 RepID=A0A0D2P4W9_HYPSF|nr:hypothetical protein HYPSUDRAFT_58785 [Hypholoma sublateritium FD-334 SS-4]